MLNNAPKPMSFEHPEIENKSESQNIFVFSKEININEKAFKIIISKNSQKLLIKSIPLNTLIPIQYEKEFTKNDLNKISKFFKMFDDIDDLIPEIISRLEKNKFKIIVNENIFQIDFCLDIKNINDFSFFLQKKKNTITVEYLYDLINSVLHEINEQKSIINN